MSEVPHIRVVRDATDDAIHACALAAGADYLVSRDDGLLSLGAYKAIKIITPEAFLKILRETEGGR